MHVCVQIVVDQGKLVLLFVVTIAPRFLAFPSFLYIGAASLVQELLSHLLLTGTYNPSLGNEHHPRVFGGSYRERGHGRAQLEVDSFSLT